MMMMAQSLTGLINIILYLCQYQRDGLVVRASASRSGGRGFEPRLGHTKDFKIGTYCLLVRRSAFKEWRREGEHA